MSEVSQQLKTEAERSVADAVTITGRLVSAELESNAADLLAGIWTVGMDFGVSHADWRGVANLPMECIDALITVQRRLK
jgi:hypothetical protein